MSANVAVGNKQVVAAAIKIFFEFGFVIFCPDAGANFGYLFAAQWVKFLSVEQLDYDPRKSAAQGRNNS